MQRENEIPQVYKMDKMLLVNSNDIIFWMFIVNNHYYKNWYHFSIYLTKGQIRKKHMYLKEKKTRNETTRNDISTAFD